MASGKESNGLNNIAFDMDMDHQRGEEGKACGSSCVTEEDRNKPTYCVTDVPPWYLCVFLAMQHYLTAFGAITAIPLILSEGLCLQHDSLTQSQLINTIFFTSGLVTVLQVTFGVRLPILQGGTFILVTPAMAMLSLPEWKCPAWTQNATLVNTSSPVFIEVWQTRLRTLQGSIMVASLLQILVGFSGLIGLLMRFIGPLTIAPTVSLIGLSLFDSVGEKAGSHWGISAMTAALIILFSQYLRRIPVPVPAYSKAKKLHTSKLYIFQIMPILLGIAVSWLVCYLLTIFDVLSADPTQYGHLARTDVKGDVVNEASWFTLPYPGQWGMPAVSLAGVFGMMAGIICSMAESVGDYYACARLSGAPPPPLHAINRGIGIEGLGSLLAGAFGTGNGTTSFSENVAALGITKVGSRMVILLSGFFMILIGILGKVGAIFATIPTPVLGGMLLIMFGVIAAAGISNLQEPNVSVAY
ncbi:solute carrier family 23 member 2-like isoform X2 [Eleginops maclovinus]|uniref:solute carrier family 23 member 2-like isoform X2 n=1 Tax=Eleginops maclovinus TaxID=56733 RepID=UPI0030808C66